MVNSVCRFDREISPSNIRSPAGCVRRYYSRLEILSEFLAPKTSRALARNFDFRPILRRAAPRIERLENTMNLFRCSPEIPIIFFVVRFLD